MRKFITALGISFLFVLLSSRILYAQTQSFDVSIDGTYTVSENGKTKVSEHVEITNRDDFVYAPSYTVNVGLDDISNISARNSSGEIPFVVKKTVTGQDIEIQFPSRVVGKGKVNEFDFSFETNKIAKKKGAIWEIDTPGLSKPENYHKYAIVLRVPESFGSPSLIKPSIPVQNGNSYRFSKDEIGTSGIFMTFGPVQYYSAKLSYHINNPNLFPIKTEIALPPNTSYQTVLIDSINPKPVNVYSDADGNWLAEYSLKPQEEKTIAVDAYIQMNANPIKSPPPKQGAYLSKVEYWNTDNTKIKELADQLKTPDNIYKYVVDTLKYNYEKTGDKNVRLGALKALQNPTNAVCLEFTDLFISIARAAGIPAREIEGYAYTDNSRLRPVSLTGDVLHAWPEYYNDKIGAWVMVDPTWGNTTDGTDYFNSLDFDHIAFVIKGQNSLYPIPAGGYKSKLAGKDITVRFITPELYKPRQAITIADTLPETSLPGLSISGTVLITNNGNGQLPASDLTISSTLNGNRQTYPIDAIPPFGSKEVEISSPRLPFLTKRVQTFTISYANQTYQKTVRSSFIPYDSIYIIGGVFLIGGIILFTFALKAWRLHLQK